MRLGFILVSGSLAAAPRDACTELCDRDGPAVCTRGSWTKGNGMCYGYVFRGDPTLRNYCYHTTATADTCPGSGRPVRPSDAARLIGAGGTTTTPEVGLGTFLTSFARDRWEEICPRMDQVDHLVAIATSPANVALGAELYWARAGGQQLLTIIGAPISCRIELLIHLGSLIAHIPGAVPAGFGSSSGLALFCRMHAQELRTLIRPGTVSDAVLVGIGRFCRRIFETPRHEPLRREMAIEGGRISTAAALARGSLRAGLPRPRLTLNRTETFTGSISYLTGDVALLHSFLPYISFLGEPEADQPGLGREWFSLLGVQIFASPSTDPNGGLFLQRPGSEFLELDLERPLNEETAPYYRAVGRYLALSVAHNQAVGAPLSRSFFRRLFDQAVTLTDIERDDPNLHAGLIQAESWDEATLRGVIGLDDDEPCPTPAEFIAESLREFVPSAADPYIAEIRRGFNDMLPLTRVMSVADLEDLRELIYGSPEISVEDLAAHTRYSGVPFHDDSPQIEWLWDWLRRSSNEVRRGFLRFVTGSRTLPMEGMAGLRSPIIVRGPRGAGFEPHAHTSSFILELPVYNSAAELEESMNAAVQTAYQM